MRLFGALRPNREEMRRGVVGLYESWNTGQSEGQLTDFRDYVERAYRQNGVIFAVVAARSRVQSEITFRWQRRDGALFRTPSLSVLERPWPNGTTGDLVQRMEQDASLAGNAYLHIADDGTIQRLRPDWVEILTDGAVPIAYRYTVPGKDPIALLADQVAHYIHEPDPLAAYRGVSWVQSVAVEVLGDKAMQRHKNKFFENAATPNLVISFAEQLPAEKQEELKRRMAQRYESTENAYRTLFVDNGADVKVVGSALDQLAFGDVQGAAEVRICNAAGTPPIVVGVTKGLESGTYSNYGLAFRSWMDTLHRPEWRKKAGALESILKLPNEAQRLWYDDSQVPALQQDAQDAANIRSRDALTIESLIRGGFQPDTAVQAVINGDYGLLKHTGLYSVQLQPPGPDSPSQETPDDDDD